MVIENLINQRTSVALDLHDCLQSFGITDQKLYDLLDQAIYSAPEIEEPVWEDIAGLTSNLVGQVYTKTLIDAIKRKIWKSIVWSSWYEYHYHSDRFQAMFGRLLAFLFGQFEDEQFYSDTLNDLISFVPSLDLKSLNRLRKVISQNPKQSQVHDLLILIDKQINLLGEQVSMEHSLNSPTNDDVEVSALKVAESLQTPAFDSPVEEPQVFTESLTNTMPILLASEVPSHISRDELVDQRATAVSALLSVVHFADEAFRETNKSTLEKANSTMPLLDDKIWGDIAFLAGLYGIKFANRELSDEERWNLWRAIVWAVGYEFYFRESLLEQRAKGAIVFLKSNSEKFINKCLGDIERIIPLQNNKSLSLFKQFIVTLSNPGRLLGVIELLESQIAETKPDITESIKSFWHLLDKRKEDQNKANFNLAIENTTQQPRLLTPLAGIIIRNAIFRYCNENYNISDMQLDHLIILANFAVKHSFGSYLEEAQINLKLFSYLRSARDRATSPDVFMHDWQSLISNIKDTDDIGIKRFWKDLVLLVTRHLSEWREDGLSDRVEAESWIKQFARASDIIEGSARQSFVNEVVLHGVQDSIPLAQLRAGKLTIQQSSEDNSPENNSLAFLGRTRTREFEEGMRRGSFPVLMDILREARLSLLSAASKVLADSQEIQPPRRTIRIQPQRNGRDLFQQARKDIMSNDLTAQDHALEVFEQGIQLNSYPDYAPIAREWNIYAKTRRFGVARGARAWLEEIENRSASHEVVWNLAIFYIQMGRVKEALDVLKPSIEKNIAPFSNLKLALYCGMQILEQFESSNSESSDLQAVTDFLVDNLPKLPFAECYLVWFLLSQDDKNRMDINVIDQAEKIGVIQDLLARPVSIPSPEDNLKDSDIEQLYSDLQRLNLNITWRIWINDYAERHIYHFKAWSWLAEVSERSGDLARAGEALEVIVNNQLKKYHLSINQKQNSGPMANYLRSNLISLFDFYQRNSRKREGKISFDRYYKLANEFWDGTDTANNRLIKLTRVYLEELEEKKRNKPTPIGLKGFTEGGSSIWSNLYQEIAEINEVGKLKEIKSRIEAAFDLMSSGPQVVQDRLSVIRHLLKDICALDESQWKRGEIENEMGRINKAIQNANDILREEPRLRDLKALVASFQRIFETFSKTLKLQAIPIISSQQFGAGLPRDVSPTSLAFRLKNPGPGEITNLRFKCSNGSTISSIEEILVDCILENEEIIITLPVNVNPPENTNESKCFIYLKYNWGVIEDLLLKHELQLTWFSFVDYLREKNIHGYEIPNPYKYRDAIDFSKDDPNLFQGRDEEITLIQKTLMRKRPAGTPLYFHGIRRVGKTSLINRIVLELQKKDDLAPVVVDLSSLDAFTQSLDQVINSFSVQILRSLEKHDIVLNNLYEVPVGHANPLAAIEKFMEDISKRVEPKKLILLIDEFQQIVADQTAALLGLIRKIYKDDQIWFVFSGRYRPEIIEKNSPRSQLSFTQRPVGFLEIENIAKVLKVPVKQYEIEIPEETVEAVFSETAGNPFLVGNIAFNGIELLNREHRNMLTPSDITLIAKQLSEDASNFTTSSFSALVLKKEEQSVAIQLAKLLGDKKIFLPAEEVLRKFDVEQITVLEEKNVIKLQSGGIGIKGQMLAKFLRTRLDIGEIPPIPLAQNAAKKVGIFVDYENVFPQIHSGMSAQTVGRSLIQYAAQFGQIVCQWACADPRNLRDPYRIKAELEQAGFSVSFPREELLGHRKKENLTDFLILERITDERTHQQPEILIIVSGDKDYFERIKNLIDQNYIFRIVANKNDKTLATLYTEFEEERKKYRFMQGFTETDFFIDDLNEILGNYPTK